MAQISANGTKLKECGNSICDLAKKYESLMTNLFAKLEKINVNAWSGASADEYVRNLKLEKNQYFALAKNIYSYGSEIYNVGESINNMVERLD